MVRTLLAALLAVLGATAPLSAQVTLNKKLVENSSYAYNQHIKSKQTMSVLGMNQDTSSEQNMVIRSTVGKREADGTIRSQSKIEQMQVTIKAPVVGEITFDSVNPDKATDSPLTALLKAGANATWSTVYDKDGNVTAVEGREKAFESLDANARAAIERQYDAAYLKAAANLALGRIPKSPIKEGESWEQTEPLRIDGSQTLTFKKKYTYRGVVDKDGKKFDKIEVKATEIGLEIAAVAQLPLKLVKSDLKIGETKGTILFDREVGRIISDTQTHQIKGKIVLGINGQELEAELDLTLDTESNDRPQT